MLTLDAITAIELTGYQNVDTFIGDKLRTALIMFNMTFRA